MKPHAEGDNFLLEIADGIAHCRVWKRPDVDSTEGAQFASRLREALTSIDNEQAHGAILDLSDAPAVAGPITQEHLSRILVWWELSHRRIAVIVGDQAIKVIQITRLVKENAPNQGRTFATVDEGKGWADGALEARARR